MCAASSLRRCHPFVAASAQVVPANAAAAVGASLLANAQQAREREQHQQRLMHRAPVPLLPHADAVERSQDFVAGHGQYFAFCGNIQRTPPRGSSRSPA